MLQFCKCARMHWVWFLLQFTTQKANANHQIRINKKQWKLKHSFISYLLINLMKRKKCLFINYCKSCSKVIFLCCRFHEHIGITQRNKCKYIAHRVKLLFWYHYYNWKYLHLIFSLFVLDFNLDKSSCIHWIW